METTELLNPEKVFSFIKYTGHTYEISPAGESIFARSYFEDEFDLMGHKNLHVCWTYDDGTYNAYVVSRGMACGPRVTFSNVNITSEMARAINNQLFAETI